ncbi:adhesion G protein-coupled receptor E1 isoform X4 [Ornithorhynchus anatinus]|uniref:adhesion G protein-coupled receptor E1 isoform X4 n=1 Tax=Ornithorhynchus anatinus TaxID=9258 RepID=UPI0010A76298|nr:adhesion G protein-coupled receptor E1 isoform X4 [Ornithorhynchus anatinus]
MQDSYTVFLLGVGCLISSLRAQIQDDDKCLDTTACPVYAICNNALGKYFCTCKKGFSSSTGEQQFVGQGVECEDVDECLDTTACPANATCSNTHGKYFCTCNKGFASSSRKQRFVGQGVECKDVDECLDTTSCPANAACSNTHGRYFCTCNKGFASSSGEKRFVGQGVECKDIDECLHSSACPQNSDCHNTLGSYSCTCKDGFALRNSQCEDVDECLHTTACPANATCRNTRGKYFCTCNEGFASSSGEQQFVGQGVECKDIDECLQSSACLQNSNCHNTVGSYSCTCKDGFVFRNSQCEDVDECLDTTACPANATCSNTHGKYFCTCNKGFASSSREQRFVGQGVECKDVDECLDTTSCPANAACSNTHGRYFCTCNKGFASSSGEKRFVGQGVECKDIDECLHSSACPQNSDCHNTLGSYSCTCKDGFALRNSQCEDVDECLHTTACPANATCRNTRGKYFCTCNEGFASSSGEQQFVGQGVECKDIDECLQSSACLQNFNCHNTVGSYSCTCKNGFVFRNSQCEDVDECLDTTACPAYATCSNTQGKYFCTCKGGFASSSGEQRFVGQGVECRDIDECSLDPALCGPNAVCSNTIGRFICSCTTGFLPSKVGPGRHGDPSHLNCTRAPFKCQIDFVQKYALEQQCQNLSLGEKHGNLSEYASFCALMNATSSALEDTCGKKVNSTVSLEKTARNFGSILEKTAIWSNLSKEEASATATAFLKSVESATMAAFNTPSVNTSQIVRSEYLDIESKVIEKGCSMEKEVFRLKAKGDMLQIDCDAVSGETSQGPSGVTFVSFVGLESILDENFFHELHDSSSAGTKRQVKMNSRVVGATITIQKSINFSKPVIYILENIVPKIYSDQLICVSWVSDGHDGWWTSAGCKMENSNVTHSVCSCRHLANLAIIMASGEITMDLALFVISHVGLILSLLCLCLAIITFLQCRSIQNPNTSIHLHLCVCLFLAELLFLTGVDKTDNKTLCAVIAGLLHYLFLACFTWMLVEAVMLFLTVRNLKVVNYFSSRNIKVQHLCVFGYGFPGVIVAAAAGIQSRDYGMHNRCWLNTESGFIWSFLGPVCCIIVINLILFTLTLWILREKLATVNANVSTLRNTRVLTLKASAQLFILGCTWILGIFQLGPAAKVMAYLFTIINSLQGVFIFFIHCVLNRQVRDEYRRCITGISKRSTKTHTSGVMLSTITSSSKTGDCPGVSLDKA